MTETKRTMIFPTEDYRHLGPVALKIDMAEAEAKLIRAGCKNIGFSMKSDWRGQNTEWILSYEVPDAQSQRGLGEVSQY